MQPADIVAFWVLVGLSVAVYRRGRAAHRAPIRVGTLLEERRAAVDPNVVARAFVAPRELDVDEQLRRAAGGRRP